MITSVTLGRSLIRIKTTELILTELNLYFLYKKRRIRALINSGI
jgi:hypothetical protein